MWISGVLAVLKVIQTGIPLAERLLGAKGRGLDKAQIVLGQAQAVAETLLPQVDLSAPNLQALVQAKIAADIALANALQAAAPMPAAPPPEGT